MQKTRKRRKKRITGEKREFQRCTSLVPSTRFVRSYQNVDQPTETSYPRTDRERVMSVEPRKSVAIS